MNEQSKKQIREWLEMDGGDTERLARWMAYNLKIAGIKECRKMIQESIN